MKEQYKIPSNESLTILKVESKKSRLTSKVEYEVYFPLYNDSLEQLNLTVCDEVKIYIPIAGKIKSDDLDKHDKKIAYYNDICYTTTSENGTDLSMKDRKKIFVENDLTLCEENCDLVG